MFLNGIITSHPFLLPPQARGGIWQGKALRNYSVKVLSGSLNAISLPGIEETQARQSCGTGPLVSERPRRAAQAPSSGRDAVRTPQITTEWHRTHERHERPDGGSTGAFSLSQASVKFWFEGGLPSAINDLLCGLLVLTALLILMCRLLQCFSTWAETPRRQRLPDDRRS